MIFGNSTYIYMKKNYVPTNKHCYFFLYFSDFQLVNFIVIMFIYKLKNMSIINYFFFYIVQESSIQFFLYIISFKFSSVDRIYYFSNLLFLLHFVENFLKFQCLNENNFCLINNFSFKLFKFSRQKRNGHIFMFLESCSIL